MRYRLEVSVSRTYIATETVTVEVEAEDEDGAFREGEIAADDKADCSVFDADHESDDITILSCEAMIDESGNPITPRCDKTKDMFE